jgi:hypothetical protein
MSLALNIRGGKAVLRKKLSRHGVRLCEIRIRVLDSPVLIDNAMSDAKLWG